MKNSLIETLEHMCALLQKKKIPYALIGGFAVTLLAKERFTRDIDFTVQVGVKQFKRFQKTFEDSSDYKIDLVQFLSSKEVPDLVRLSHQSISVDLLYANTKFQKELIKRAHSYPLGKGSIKIASPEDLIVLKLLADRPQDWQDIQSLKESYPKLNLKYLKKWAKYWGIEERLSKIL